jgi:hypothetical protein
MRLSALSIAAALCLAYGTTALAADPPDPPPKTGGDAAAAQAMFYEARQLMKANKFGLACPKLEESLRLDYGIGTEFNLADCHEKVGKVASAWSGFLSVASAAHTSHQTDREKVARDRAKALEPRLPKLTIEVPPGAPAGLEVKRDGVVVGQAGWNTPVPVDPGTHDITVTAPGKIAWHGNVSIAEQKSAKITVPKLEDQAVAAAPKAATPPAEATSTTTITSFPEPIVENRGQTQRTIGWVVGGVGIASLAVGAGFGINSLAQRAQANDHCNKNDICDAQGVKDRNAAITSGDVSTVTTIAGAGAILGGIVLVLTAPKTPSREKATVAGSIHAVPQVATNGAGLSIQGILP